MKQKEIDISELEKLGRIKVNNVYILIPEILIAKRVRTKYK